MQVRYIDNLTFLTYINKYFGNIPKVRDLIHIATGRCRRQRDKIKKRMKL